MSINNTSSTHSLVYTVHLLLNNMWMNIAERVTESCLVKCLKVLLAPRCTCCDSGHACHSTQLTPLNCTNIYISNGILPHFHLPENAVQLPFSRGQPCNWKYLRRINHLFSFPCLFLSLSVTYTRAVSLTLSLLYTYTHIHTCTCHHDNKRFTNMCGGARVRMSRSDWVQPV